MTKPDFYGKKIGENFSIVKFAIFYKYNVWTLNQQTLEMTKQNKNNQGTKDKKAKPNKT